MEENKNIEETGVSLGDIFRWILRGKIPAAITAVVAFVILYVLLAMIVSPSSQYYVVEFDYSSVPGLSDGTYVDGSKFSYQDLIVEENVNAVIEENKESYDANLTSVDFSSIDVYKLYSSNEFKITTKRVYWETASDSTAEPELKGTYYVLEMPTGAFKNSTQAKAFAKALIERPLDKTKAIIQTLDFETYLTMYNRIDNFESKLEYLTKQIALIKDGYSSFAGIVNGTRYVIDGKTYNFEEITAAIDAFLVTKNFSTMEAELRQIGYVNDKDVARKKYELEMDDLKKEWDLLNKKLSSVKQTYDDAKEALKGMETGNVVSSDQILSLLTQLNETLLNQKTDLELQIIDNEEKQRKLKIKIDALDILSDADNAAFAARLDSIYTRLVEETKTYDTVYKSINTRNVYVYYESSNVISVDGGLSTVMTLGVPVLMALLGFVVVGWIYGYVKCQKEE